jgi:hypothetical protein
MEEYNPNYWEDEQARIKQEIDSEIDNVRKANQYLNRYREFNIELENIKSKSLDKIYGEYKMDIKSVGTKRRGLSIEKFLKIVLYLKDLKIDSDLAPTTVHIDDRLSDDLKNSVLRMYVHGYKTIGFDLYYNLQNLLGLNDYLIEFETVIYDE